MPALANAAGDGEAPTTTVAVEAAGDRRPLGIGDGGVGGVDFGRGSRLVLIEDRVEGLDARVAVQSDPFAGASLEIDSAVNERVRALP